MTTTWEAGFVVVVKSDLLHRKFVFVWGDPPECDRVGTVAAAQPWLRGL